MQLFFQQADSLLSLFDLHPQANIDSAMAPPEYLSQIYDNADALHAEIQQMERVYRQHPALLPGGISASTAAHCAAKIKMLWGLDVTQRDQDPGSLFYDGTNDAPVHQTLRLLVEFAEKIDVSQWPQIRAEWTTTRNWKTNTRVHEHRSARAKLTEADLKKWKAEQPDFPHGQLDSFHKLEKYKTAAEKELDRAHAEARARVRAVTGGSQPRGPPKRRIPEIAESSTATEASKKVKVQQPTVQFWKYSSAWLVGNVRKEEESTAEYNERLRAHNSELTAKNAQLSDRTHDLEERLRKYDISSRATSLLQDAPTPAAHAYSPLGLGGFDNDGGGGGDDDDAMDVQMEEQDEDLFLPSFGPTSPHPANDTPGTSRVRSSRAESATPEQRQRTAAPSAIDVSSRASSMGLSTDGAADDRSIDAVAQAHEDQDSRLQAGSQAAAGTGRSDAPGSNELLEQQPFAARYANFGQTGTSGLMQIFGQAKEHRQGAPEPVQALSPAGAKHSEVRESSLPSRPRSTRSGTGFRTVSSTTSTQRGWHREGPGNFRNWQSLLAVFPPHEEDGEARIAGSNWTEEAFLSVIEISRKPYSVFSDSSRSPASLGVRSPHRFDPFANQSRAATPALAAIREEGGSAKSPAPGPGNAPSTAPQAPSAFIQALREGAQRRTAQGAQTAQATGSTTPAPRQGSLPSVTTLASNVISQGATGAWRRPQPPIRANLTMPGQRRSMLSTKAPRPHGTREGRRESRFLRPDFQWHRDLSKPSLVRDKQLKELRMDREQAILDRKRKEYEEETERQEEERKKQQAEQARPAPEQQQQPRPPSPPNLMPLWAQRHSFSSRQT